MPFFTFTRTRSRNKATSLIDLSSDDDSAQNFFGNKQSNHQGLDPSQAAVRDSPTGPELETVVVEDLSINNLPNRAVSDDNTISIAGSSPIISIGRPMRTATSITTSPGTTPAALLSSTRRETSPPFSSVSSKTKTPTTKQTSKVSSPAWINWVGNQQSSPVAIFYPSTLIDIQSIIQQARTNRRKIRCVAGSYSMSSVSRTDGYLVNTKYLSVIDPPRFENNHDSWTVKVQAGVSVKALDDYLRNHDPPLAMSSNVFLESALYGGIVAIGAHGAEINGRCLSDQVSEISIVDGTGVLQTFNSEKDSIEFSAARLNLGLFGIIYTLTLKVIPMATTRYHALDWNLPSPQYFDPRNLLSGLNLKDLVSSNAHVELIYFPFNQSGECRCNDHVRIKTMNPTNQLPTSTKFFQRLHHKAADLPTFMKLVKSMYRCMEYWPRSTRLVTKLYDRMTPKLDCVQEIPNAVHFLKNVDIFPTWLMEFSIKCDDDFRNVIWIWDQVVGMVYEAANQRNEFPLNVALEARFNKSSRCILSPLYDQDENAIMFSIELVSGKNTKGFTEFANRVAQLWMSQGGLPHWGKIWEDFDGVLPHIRHQMGSRVETFNRIRGRLDPDNLFMTDVFSNMLSLTPSEKKSNGAGMDAVVAV